MRYLFAPPTYELPNNVIFEAIGILQIGPALAAGYRVMSLIAASRHGAWSLQNEIEN
jgi:hypothetical protein